MIRRPPRSRRTAPLFPDPTLCRSHRMIRAFQVLLALAYTVLAHLSNALDRPGLGAIALALLALMLLLAPMARRRWWAWLALPLLLFGVTVLHQAELVRAPMLLVPVAFVRSEERRVGKVCVSKGS